MEDAAPDRLIGRTLGGRYRIEGRIARGGMATVYYAIDTRLDRAVALKVMHPGLSADPAFVERFMSEARAAAGLSHPNIVAVFDQGTDGDLGYLTMEYVDGRTLREVLREHGPLTLRQAFSVIEPVLAALGAAHRAGFVHRDVKPENILVADDGSVKVTDFGLARATDAPSTHTSAGVLLGTVAYISPEQVDGAVADSRSDVYSTGIVLYELLTGAKPYVGESSLHIAYQHANSDVPPPSALVPDLSPLVDGLVSYATQRDPQLRPADANAYLAELREVRRQLREAELDAGGTARVAAYPAVARAGRGRSGAVVLAHWAEHETAVLRHGPGSLAERSVNGSSPPGAAEATRRLAPISERGPGARRHASPGAAPRARRRGGLAMTFLLAAALVVGLFAWWLGGGGHANVPAVVGMTQEQAIAAARDAGLKVQVGPAVFSDEVEPGLIASSDPPPGSRVNRGSDLVLYPSRGPELFAVPDLTGTTVTEAESLLAEASLQLGEVTEEYDGRLSEGAIISTDPAAGEQVPRETAVVVIVSRGPQPIEVPNVVGEHIEEARAILDAAGFAVSEDTAPSEVPAEIVVAQNPADGTAPTGSTVELTVSAGPQLVEVPDVRGMEADQATKALEDAGFAATIEIDLPGRRDEVVAQNPGPGSEAPTGSTIRLWIS